MNETYKYKTLKSYLKLKFLLISIIEMPNNADLFWSHTLWFYRWILYYFHNTEYIVWKIFTVQPDTKAAHQVQHNLP